MLSWMSVQWPLKTSRTQIKHDEFFVSLTRTLFVALATEIIGRQQAAAALWAVDVWNRRKCSCVQRQDAHKRRFIRGKITSIITYEALSYVTSICRLLS